MDREAWWSIVHGVAKSRTRPSTDAQCQSVADTECRVSVSELNETSFEP